MKSARVLQGPHLPTGRRLVHGPTPNARIDQGGGQLLPPAGHLEAVSGAGSDPEDGAASRQPAYEDAVTRGLAHGMEQAEQRIGEEIERRWAAQKRVWDAELQRQKDEFAATVGALRAAVAALNRARHDLLPVMEEQAIALAFEAVCRILGPQAPMPTAQEGLQALLVNLVSGGLQQMHGHQVLTIRLHPQDHAAIVSAFGEGKGTGTLATEVQWVADARLARLAPRLESAHGSLDVSMQTQLERLMSLWLAGSQGGGTLDAGAPERTSTREQ
jgi:flagellar assembly protein FliH